MRATSMTNGRNSEALDFQVSTGSIPNHTYQPDMDWSFNNAILSVPTSPTTQDVNLSVFDQIVEPSQTQRQDSICWLERCSSRDTRSIQSTTHGAGTITAEDGLDFLSELSVAMKHSTESIIASWEALKVTPNHVPNILERRPATCISDSMKQNFLWSRIASYVTDFDKAILPPFIHRNYLLKDGGSQIVDFANLPEPLANCKNVVPMYLQKTPACKQLVLKTFLLEVQRLHAEFCNYDESTLLSALQAMTVYSILLAMDKERCKLISMITRIAMGEIANAVQNLGYYCVAENRGNFPRWSDWILQECKRRTMIVLHLMAYLLDMDVGKAQPSSCVGFDKVPLPCGKSMFLAQTASSWEDEYKKYLSSRNGSEMPTVGNLRKMFRTETNDWQNDLVKDLSGWSKDVDDLGSLLLVAV
ncbi:uncharacterized protein LY89DRAFT_18568 [Mollisia scopiformis]|uniref:Transcription factor domain-containing protein n=1 Tax=Mollisia scopiformis TaxID=149040 RepID=A0A194XVT2_MOLSC|nr:uncharacterized protein LY89DRAFT_18568 [Mollisia scopiformis]KUJ24333.1 hypothetical protein LY89DRAFT_18568 [Mollisia scopiformis]